MQTIRGSTSPVMFCDRMRLWHRKEKSKEKDAQEKNVTICSNAQMLYAVVLGLHATCLAERFK